MSKTSFIVMIIALLSMAGQAQVSNYTVNGIFPKMTEAMANQSVSFDTVSIINSATMELIAKQAVPNGKFSISGEVEKPYCAFIGVCVSSFANGEKRQRNIRFPIIIEPGEITFDATGRTPTLRGTPLNDAVYGVLETRQSANNPQEFTNLVRQLVLQHKDDAAAIPLLLMLDDNVVEPEVLLSLINQSCADVQNHPNVIKVKKKAEAALSQQEGEMFKDFAVDYNGKTYNITCVSMGNPHAVIFTDLVDALDLEKIGPDFETHKIFPERVNTEFIKVIDDHTLKMRVWERGSGETLACGTGACAAAVAACLNGYCKKGDDIKVILRGGELIIRYTDDAVYMTGNCEKVFTGSIEI